MIYVRRATEDDVPDLVRLARRFHGESPTHRPLRFVPEKVDGLIRVALADSEWLVPVAVDDEGIMGMAMIYALPQFFSDERVAGDFAFYVVPDRRGTRAAILMLDMIEDWCIAMECRRIDIGLNTGINHEAAAAFFTKRGLPISGLIVGRALS